MRMRRARPSPSFSQSRVNEKTNKKSEMLEMSVKIINGIRIYEVIRSFTATIGILATPLARSENKALESHGQSVNEALRKQCKRTTTLTCFKTQKTRKLKNKQMFCISTAMFI